MSVSDVDGTTVDLDQIMAEARKIEGIRRERKKSGKHIAADVTLRSQHLDGIQMTISALPEAWKSLYENFDPTNDEDMTLLGRLVWLNAIQPVWDEELAPWPSRLDPFTNRSWRFVAAAWVITSHWLDCDPWPDPLEEIVRRFKKNKADIDDDRAVGPPPRTIALNKLVFNLWKEAFAHEIEKPKPRGPRNSHSFHTQYVQKNPYIEQAQDILKQSPAPPTIETIEKLTELII
ncbi:MAG: hypothetical protein H8E10_08030 [Desulfobacterales bacterium]|nr:hypothetical protein [Desulfobacterales bacterium]